MSEALLALQKKLNSYYPLNDNAWQAYQACCRERELKKGEVLYPLGEHLTHFSFLHKGLMRAYVLDENGNEFNKNFFSDGRFPGSMTALLMDTPNQLAIQALEDCSLIEIDHEQYRAAMAKHKDLMMFQIHYIETHWIIGKEAKEISYLMDEAKTRYLTFLDRFAQIADRIPQFHVASYLGITPTQLSRIRKELKSSQ